MEKIPITQAGFENLKVQLQKLKTEERPRIIQSITEARSHGSLSKNPEFQLAINEQEHNETRIQELEDQIIRAEIIDFSNFSCDTVKFGTTVELEDEVTAETKVYQIVGELEADGNRTISNKSLLGISLLGKSVGDLVSVNTKSYEILSIEIEINQFVPKAEKNNHNKDLTLNKSTDHVKSNKNISKVDFYGPIRKHTLSLNK